MKGTDVRWVSGVLYLAIAWVLISVVNWGVFQATFSPDISACQAAHGACWGVIVQKWKVILFGRYPESEVWRPAIFCFVWSIGLFWAFYGQTSFKYKLIICLVGAVLLLGFLLGGIGALVLVPTSLWGGLSLTLIISVVGMGLAFPLGVLLAVGRHFGVKLIRWFCVFYIELLRALPLISVLFLAAFVLPLFLGGQGGDLLFRVIITIAFFASAYIAEVVRGGLQVVSEGQVMAAKSLGLGFAQVQGLVVLPQAIRHCAPSLLNSFVTLFKECSLVSIVSLFELTGALGLALSGDVKWRQFYFEGYVFIGFVYWVYCHFLSKKAGGSFKSI